MKPVISIIMGSKSDWATMQKAAEVLDNFDVAYEKKVVSAHRTPDLMFKHAEEARPWHQGHHRWCWWRCSLARYGCC